ncbi:hypothetical protein vBSenH9_60 [Salmonella phage vB_Sen_H9]|uniref:Uncharacterized protein n=1 Tax=Salmonella phage vB_Sen_I1 TaxID=2723910 RepID=A0A7L5CBH5_9CAUD|nr:hypothetical protein vBSenI1_85 [Salmonella phage vB_Sen_I1]QJA18025.1 hypothetical protein vBSenH9_60 [Salmonella phage vB_Sen_H9]
MEFFKLIIMASGFFLIICYFLADNAEQSTK